MLFCLDNQMILSVLVGLLIFLVKFSAAVENFNSSSLKFVHVIWRHGDRTPSGTFPTDENKIWREGFGELTTIGMLQEFRLGQFIRQRYREFLSPNYDTFEIYVRSTDYNRTIMSALANMAGFFYPPDKNFTFLGNLSWHPVPIHTIPKPKDPILWMDCPCPKVDEIVAEVEKKTDLFVKWQNLIKFVEPLANVTVKSFYDVWKLYDPIFGEWQHKAEHPPPSWVNESIYNQIISMYYDSTKLYYSTPEWQRLRGGLLMNEIAERLQSHTNGSLDPRLKFYAYSAHDTTLIAALQNLGIYDGKNPPFASAFFIELHKTNDGLPILKFFYHNETDSQAEPQELYPTVFHSSPSSLAEYAKWAKERAPSNWAQECGTERKEEQENWKDLAIAFGILAVLFAVLFVFVLWQYLRTSKFQPLHDSDGELLR